MRSPQIIIGLALLVPAISFAQKVDMKLNLEKGKEYTQKTEVENTTKQTISGQVMEINTSATATTFIEMTEDNGKTDTYKFRYGNVGMSSSAMGQTQAFSSDTASLETVDPMSRVFARLTNKEFSAKITEKGMVEEVMGLEELVKGATAEMPGGQAMIDQVSGSFGDDGFAKNLELTTDIFPAKAVKVGDSWTKEQFTSTGLPIIATSIYTLKSVNGGTAVIDVVAKLATDPSNSSTQMQGMDATQYYEGERTGTLNVEVASGWVTSGTLQDDVVGSISFTPNAQMPDGMTVPIEMKNVITISN